MSTPDKQRKKPIKFSPKVQECILEHLEKGYTREHAGRLAGGGRNLVSNWVRRGEKGEERFQEFAKLVGEAEQKSQSILVDHIKIHAEKDWRAAAWLLERRFDSFKLKSRTSQEAQNKLDSMALQKAEAELEYTQAKTKALNRGSMTPDQLLEVLERVREAAKQEAKEEMEERVH
tara:strand:+ start:1430 stop:1954 length:525 start_codon:yes stop_codon:yes gene_type:complete